MGGDGVGGEERGKPDWRMPNADIRERERDRIEMADNNMVTGRGADGGREIRGGRGRER